MAGVPEAAERRLKVAPGLRRGLHSVAAARLSLLLLFCVSAFAQSSAPAITVNGTPILLSQSTARVGGDWYVQLLPVAKALQIELNISAASPILSTRRSDGTEITYDFRTGEIRNRYVLVGTVKRYQDIKPAASADMLMFPISGVVALFGVDVSEDQQRNVLEIASAGNPAGHASAAPTLNLSGMNYRYGLTTNGHRVAQFLDLTGEGLLGSIRTRGKALLSGYPGQRFAGLSQASIRADWMDDKALVLGNQNVYTAIDALNAATLAGSFERRIGAFRSSAYAGRAVGMTQGTIGVSHPHYDTTLAGMSLRRTVRAGELSFGVNMFSGASRNGDTIGIAYTAAASTRNQLKVQTLFGKFSGLSSRTVVVASSPTPAFFQQEEDQAVVIVEERRRQRVRGTAAGLSIADSFTPVRQLTLSGQYEFYGKNFLTANDDSRFNGQTTRAVSVTVRPVGFLSLNGGVNEHHSFIGDTRIARNYTYGANVSAPLGTQLGLFQSIQKDPGSPLSQFVMTQYSLGLPPVGRFAGNIMVSDLNFQGKKVRNINTLVSVSQTRFGQIAFHDQIQLGTNHRIGAEVYRDLSNGGTMRIGVDRIFSRGGTGGFAPTATIQLPLPRGRSLQISYIGDRRTHLIQLEFGGHLRENRGVELDSRGNPRVVADAPLVGRMYLDSDSDGKFDAAVDRPIAGVVVWLDDSKFAKTDSQGFYKFDQVEPGAHHLRSDIAAVPADMTFAGAGERTISVAPYRNNVQDLRLLKTGRVAGKVVYMDYSDIDNPVERPMPDARIIATDRFDTFSEVDGHFLLGDLPPGDYSFQIDPGTIPAKYAPKRSIVPVSLKPGQTVNGILFELIVPPKPVIMLN